MIKPFVICVAIWAALPSQSTAQANFSVSGTRFTAPAHVTFTHQDKAPRKNMQYHWDFGDGSTSQEFNPVHRYGHSGNYVVTLTATKGKKAKTSTRTIQVIAPDRCMVEIETEFGIMVAELYNATPKHRDNFIKLAEEKYYDDLLFHRIINGFMIQGGDPDSRNAPPEKALGGGGPRYLLPAEFVDSLCHIKGALAAARTNNPEKKSSGSQFYIVQGSGPMTDEQLDEYETSEHFHYTPEQRAAYKAVGGTPQLDRKYTVFGRVVEGLEVIDKIAAVERDDRDRPRKDVKMKVRVIK